MPEQFRQFRNHPAILADPLGRSRALEKVPGLLGFGLQVAPIVDVGGKGVRHPFHHHDALGRERRDLFGIVRQEPDGFVSEERQHARGNCVKALVRLETQSLVGLDRIESLVLQAIRPELVDQSDAAAFLGEIKQNTSPCRGNRLDRAAQLRAAIAFQRPQKIARKALRMQADQHRPISWWRADHNRVMFGTSIRGTKGDKLGPLGPFQRYACTGDDGQRLDGFPFETGNCLGGDSSGSRRPRADMEHQHRRKETSELCQPDGGRKGSVQRRPDRVERALERFGQISGRIGNRAQPVQSQRPFRPDGSHIRSIETDFEGTGARVRQHQQGCAVTLNQTARHGVAGGFDGQGKRPAVLASFDPNRNASTKRFNGTVDVIRLCCANLPPGSLCRRLWTACRLFLAHGGEIHLGTESG